MCKVLRVTFFNVAEFDVYRLRAKLKVRRRGKDGWWL